MQTSQRNKETHARTPLMAPFSLQEWEIFESRTTLSSMKMTDVNERRRRRFEFN
jgi:hypothetical protein